MAIEKMVFLKIVGSIDDMHEVLKCLVLSESLHLDFDETKAYDNSFIIHKYESAMVGSASYQREDIEEIEAKCNEIEHELEELSKGFSIILELDKDSILGTSYSLNDAVRDIGQLLEEIGPSINEIRRKKAAISQYEQFREKLLCINDKELNFGTIAGLNYFDYEIGALSNENKLRLKKNYENISAVVLNIGNIKDSVEDLYVIIYPRKFSEEISKLLKSLNWVKLDIPDEMHGTVRQMISGINDKISSLNREIYELTTELDERKEEVKRLLTRVYTVVKLERRILSIKREVLYGEGTFALNAWARKDDRVKIEKALGSVLSKIIIEERNPDDIGSQAMPPTQFKNNRFFKPFETIVKLYGLPSYYEIDPTPFVAVTFFLMFGIMFGDIGQGLVYFLAGLLLYKRIPVAGQLLTRLGGSSILFGFVYGSFFGLEQAELPWLPSLIGRPLDPANIPYILISGVVFGAGAITISFIFGIINSLRKGDLEAGIFGKNGIAGYIFFIGLIASGVAVTGIIPLPVTVPLLALFVSLLAMLAKEPMANLVVKRRPLIHGKLSSYLTESIFEGVETILSTLSNAISFIRVGAFALNHAGLFLAFLVMSEMTENIVLKLLILLLGNILILTLEGLVVFIQGLRLQYYEMFGKYFHGDGVAFDPAKITN